MALHVVVMANQIYRPRLLATVLIVGMVAVPLLTQTRSGLLLALFMFALIWWLMPGRSFKILLYGLGMVVVVVALVFSNKELWSRGDNTLSEIVQYSEQQQPVELTSATSRIELWRAAARMFVEHPLLGVGNHRFRSTLGEYQKQGKASSRLELYSHPHNEILRFAAESGLPGLLSLALLYFVPLAIGLRAYRRAPSARNPALLLIVFSTGFLIAGLVDVILAWSAVILFYGLVTSFLIARIDTVPDRVHT
jgi:O-antigen ligase